MTMTFNNHIVLNGKSDGSTKEVKKNNFGRNLNIHKRFWAGRNSETKNKEKDLFIKLTRRSLKLQKRLKRLQRLQVEKVFEAWRA